MGEYQQLTDYYGKNPNAETPAPGKGNNDTRILHEVAKQNAGK
jgi:hypothetical protein